MKRLLFASLLLTGLAIPAAADDAPPAPSDVQDLVYLRGGRPVLFRLHVRVDGKPLAAVWEAYMDQLFAHLDVNGDGVLDEQEAGRAPRAQLLAQTQQGRGFLGQFAAADVKELQPKDGKVTRAKLAAYYRRSGMAMFQLMTDADATAQAAAVTDALFKALDRDGDGKLSKDELARAADSLRRFDVDDDETVSAQELAPTGGGLPFRQPQSQTGNDAFLAVDPHDRAALVAKLLEVFDKDKNKKLTRAEIDLDETRFEQLDADGDGELNAEELARFATLPPDGEFTLRLGRLGAGEAASGAEQASLPVSKSGEGLDIQMGTMQLGLRPSKVPANAPGANLIRQFLMQQFKGLAGTKGYVEKKDLQANARFFGPVFPLADRDGDGKLTEKELTAFLDIVDQANRGFVMLTVTDRGHGLFDALDGKRDGRLRFHELRAAWDRLAAWDRAGQGFVTRADIPARLELSLTHGNPNPPNRGVVFRTAARPTRSQEPARGPLWFRKMDRNADGVVSQREWLGSTEDFQRFDANADGVIDLTEAEQADAILRVPVERKP